MKKIIIPPLVVLVVVAIGFYVWLQSNGIVHPAQSVDGWDEIHNFLVVTWKDTIARQVAVVSWKNSSWSISSQSWNVVSGSTENKRDSYVKPSEAQLQKILTPLQYKVTQQEATEPSYNNEYRDNHAAGIYVDVVSGEPLFSSTDKYDSQTGRPSFTKPLVAKNIIYKSDMQLLEARTEVRSKHADSHLGHVFDDGPEPLWKRYCMNSAALKFIPAKDLEKEWYSEFVYLFK